jgi:hypothetical protein
MSSGRSATAGRSTAATTRSIHAGKAVRTRVAARHRRRIVASIRLGSSTKKTSDTPWAVHAMPSVPSEVGRVV